MRLLDIASSDFRMARLFPGVEYFGGDVDISALEDGKSKHPGGHHHPVCCDLRCLPFPDASFDIVISTHTLVHLPARWKHGQAIAELLRVVRPDGDLVFNIRNKTDQIAAAAHVLEGQFEKVTIVWYRRRLMFWWGKRVVAPLKRKSVPRGLPLLRVVAPLIHLADRFGPPVTGLYFCEGRIGGPPDTGRGL